jgi:hypothetical protein
MEGEMNRSIRKFSLLGLVLFFAVTEASAQDVTGTIAGSVTDSTGAAMPGVTVSVVNVGTNATYQGNTTDFGTYSIRSSQSAFTP